MHKVKAFTQLSEGERLKIEVLLGQGLSIRRIAALLKRAASTICREVRRNAAKRDGYRAAVAQHKTRRRHRDKPKHRVFSEAMKRFVKEGLEREKLSPELISVQGRKKWDDFVSHEWIYRFIWRAKFSQKKEDKAYRHLYTHLRHARRRRRRSRKRHNRGNILQRTFIEQRPCSANLRKTRGHLEGDIVLGLQRKPGLLVVLDRKTRKTWLRKLPRKDAAFVGEKLKAICKTSHSVHTLTLDNDQSFAQHYRLHPQGVKTFFTRPYCSQDKGSVENRIGILRQFFPKTTDFSGVSHQRVKQVENYLNNRPLRMFGYQTPNQLWEKSPPLKKQTVALMS